MLALLGAAPVSLWAGDVSWFVAGDFSDSGTVIGTFVYDADTGVMRSWSLATSGGDTESFPAFTYTPQNSSFSMLSGVLIFQGPLAPAINPFSNGFRDLRIGPFSSPLSDAGGSVTLPADNFGNQECYNCGPTRILSGSVTGTPLPDLTITKSHTGNFNVGQTGSNPYDRGNQLPGKLSTPEGQLVTVVDSLPSPEFSAVAISGTGWNCSLGNLTCTTNAAVPPGASLPPITVQVNVNLTASTSVTNVATVSGGGEANTSNDTAMDPTNILHSDMTISLSANGSFKQGDLGDTYSLVVGNAGSGASVGNVTVTDSLPVGLTPTAINGPGWSCNVSTLTCVRADSLLMGSSYPPITVTVNVASNSPASLMSTATVSGGAEINTANNVATNTVNLVFPPLNCAATAATAPLLRQEGGAELAGDLVVNCTGGIPTPQGQPLPILQFSLGLSPLSALGVRLLSGAIPAARGDALALVDEPNGTAQISSATQLLCLDPVVACSIAGTGSGQGDYNGSPGRPNVFQSFVNDANSVRFMIPFDPPGLGARTVRLTNLRVDARVLAPGPVSAGVGITGSLSVPLSNPVQVIGSVGSGEAVSVQGGNATPNRISTFTVTFQEASGSSLRTRTAAAFVGNDVSPPPADQNVPGKIYDTETGFHNGAFPVAPSQGDLSQAGLADSGTRLFIQVSGVPPGVQLMVPGAVHSSTANIPNIGILRLIATDARGAGAFAPNGAALSVTPMSLDASGNAYATYEVLSTDPLQMETVSIPVLPVYPPNSSIAWLATQVTAGQAPLDPTSGPNASAPVPRFSSPASFPVSAAQPPPVISTTTLPSATAGQPYSFTFAATSGLSPYTWSATGLPSFLTISIGGILSGNFPGGSLTSYSFSVSVKDSKGVTVSSPITIAVIIPPPLTITTTSAPRGVAGQPYNFVFAATGGATPYTWSSSGLPAFLILSTSGPLTGTIPANPLASYSFAVSVTDAKGMTASTGITLNIDRPPLSVDVSQIPPVAVGTHFSTMLNAGGLPPITWTGSGLPSWISLSTKWNSPGDCAPRSEPATTGAQSKGGQLHHLQFFCHCHGRNRKLRKLEHKPERHAAASFDHHRPNASGRNGKQSIFCTTRRIGRHAAIHVVGFGIAHRILADGSGIAEWNPRRRIGWVLDVSSHCAGCRWHNPERSLQHTRRFRHESVDHHQPECPARGRRSVALQRCAICQRR